MILDNATEKATLITLAISIFSSPALLYFMKYYVNKQRRKENKRPKLSQHYIFNQFNELLVKISSDFQIENDFTKQKIFTDLLINKLLIWKHGLQTLIYEVDILCISKCNSCEVDIQKSLNLHVRIFNDCMVAFNNYYNNGKYTDEEKELIKHAMAEFNKWHNVTGERVRNYIHDVHANSGFFVPCYKSITASVLTIYQGAFEEMWLHAASAIKGINGTFKNKTFGFDATKLVDDELKKR